MSIRKLGGVVYSICTSSTRPASPIAGTMIYETDTNLNLVYNGSAWVCVTPQNATVAAGETTTSTSYADLATPGPTVTVTTGTKVLIHGSALLQNSSAGNYSNVGILVSGASSRGAGAEIQYYSASVNDYSTHGFLLYLTTLTAGSNTFKMQYKAGAGTFYAENRQLSVVGVP